jgi:hypothetical protein
MLKPAHTLEKLKQSVKERLRASHESKVDLQGIVGAAPSRDRESFRETLLEVLATAAAHARIGGSEAILAAPMRRRARQLRSLAEQMRTVANHAERLANDKDSNLDPWARLMPGALGGKCSVDEVDWCKPDLIETMRRCAERAVFQARAFGFYTRRRIGQDRWLDAKILVDLVKADTGQSFYSNLARLLTDAYEAAGVSRTFSAEQLRKIVSRYPDL